MTADGQADVSDPPEGQAERSIPHSREAEQAVIGAVLIDADLYPSLRDRLKPEDFYLVRYRLIWESFARLANGGFSIDFVNVADDLGSIGRLEDIGGQGALLGLIAQTATSLNAESHAERVRESAGRRAILHLSGESAGFAYQGRPVSEILEHMRNAITQISGAEPGSPARKAKDLLEQAYLGVGSGGAQMVVISTGLTDLDKLLLGGLHRDGLYVVAGRPGSGKSALLLGIAAHAAGQGQRVGLFSLEMPAREQADRLLSQLSGVPHERIAHNLLHNDDWEPFTQAVQNGGELDISIDDSPFLSIPDLRAKCRRLADRGLDLLVIDSLNLLDAQKNGDKLHERVNWLAYQLMVIARELGVPVLAAHHMSRRFEIGGERDPEMADLEQAGEKPADMVAFPYRKGKDQPERDGKRAPREAWLLKVAKHRNGATGLVRLAFLPPTLRFVDAGASQKEDVKDPKDFQNP